jgi:hypothetical protein
VDDERLISELTREGTLEDLAQQLASLVRTGLRLEAVEGTPAIGDSKVGGEPDLPADMPWPSHTWRDGSHSTLRFVAQLRLGDLDPQVWPGPSTGLLSIFHAFPHDEDFEAVCVVQIPKDAELRRRPGPDEPAEELRVRLTPVLTLPHFGVGPARAIAKFGFDWDEPRGEQADDYLELLEALDDAQPTEDGELVGARILGWPWFVQDDVLAELADDDLGWENYTSLLSIWLQETAVTAIVLPAADLAAGRFDRVRASSQSD